MQIMVWRSRMLDNLRAPPRKELMEAWRKLMQSKLKRRLPLNSTQALQCRRLLEYLFALEGVGEDQQVKNLTAADLAMARKVLLDFTPYERTKNHLDFGKALQRVWESGSFAAKTRNAEMQWSFRVNVLSEYGAATEAAQMLKSKWGDPNYSALMAEEGRLLELVSRGLAREGKEEELVDLANFAMQDGVLCDASIQTIMVEYFAARDRVAEAKHWFTQATNQRYPQAQVYRAVASLARRNGLQQWAVPLLLQLGESQPRKRHWDVILQSILLLGKSLSEVNALMEHMVDQNGPLLPTHHTINGLLAVALEMGDSRLAEDVLVLGAEKGIAPKGETYLILLQLWLAAGDLKKAEAAFEQVKHFEPWANESGVDLLERFRRCTTEFLLLLSKRVPPDFPHMLQLLEAVEEYQMLLEPEAAGALCVKFLENDQHFDVMDLLSVHSFLYSEQQREVVQAAFVAFCLDAGTSTSRAWSAYQLLRQYFQDTSFELRTKLMGAFFDRKRPDMAAHVFGHMRQHRNKAYHPTMATYIQYLEGVAANPDPEGLLKIHNMLKMDATIRPDTKLYTGLMLAYTACDKPLAALDFWTEITRSAEGPSYASLEAVFWALERRPGGGKQAREIWERMERMDLDVPPAVYSAYLGAIAGSGNEKEVRSLLTKMASYVGSEPDATT